MSMALTPEGTLPLVPWSVISPYEFELAAFGRRILIGYPSQTINGKSLQGAVYAFHRTSAGAWEAGQRLLPTRPSGNADAEKIQGPMFGNSLAIQGDRCIIGSHTESPKHSWSGAAYVFAVVDGKWKQVARLVASDAASKDYFGFSVALSADGKTAFVGAAGDDSTAVNTGSLYVFHEEASGWKQVMKLSPSKQGAAVFGSSVIADSELLVVGARSDGTGSTDYPAYPPGLVYVYDTALRQKFILRSPEPQALAGFGHQVALTKDHIVVAAPFFNSPAGKDTGAVYVFDRGGSYVSTLTASDKAISDAFGWSLDAQGDVIVVGNRTPYGGPKYGQTVAYVFERDGGFVQRERLAPTDVRTTPQTGTRVALDEDSIALAGYAGPKARAWGYS